MPFWKGQQSKKCPVHCGCPACPSSPEKANPVLAAVRALATSVGFSGSATTQAAAPAGRPEQGPPEQRVRQVACQHKSSQSNKVVKSGPVTKSPKRGEVRAVRAPAAPATAAGALRANTVVESTTGRPRSTNGTRRQKRDRAQAEEAKKAQEKASTDAALGSLRVENAMLLMKNTGLTKDNTDLQDRLEEAEAQQRELRSLNTEVVGELRSINAELAGDKGALQWCVDLLEAERSEQQSRQAVLEADKAALQARVEAFEMQQSELHDLYTMAVADKGALQVHLDQAEMERCELRVVCQELRALEPRLAAVELDNTMLRIDIGGLNLRADVREAKLVELEHERDGLQSRLGDAEAKIGKLESTKAGLLKQVAAAKSREEKLPDRVKQLKEQVAVAKSREEDCKARLDRTTKLERALKKLGSENAELKKQLEASPVKKAEADLREAVSLRANTERERETWCKTWRKIRARNSELEGEVEELKDQLSHFEAVKNERDEALKAHAAAEREVARLEKERSVSKREEFKRALSIVEGLMEKDAEVDLGDIAAEEKVPVLQKKIAQLNGKLVHLDRLWQDVWRDNEYMEKKRNAAWEKVTALKQELLEFKDAARQHKDAQYAERARCMVAVKEAEARLLKESEEIRALTEALDSKAGMLEGSIKDPPITLIGRNLVPPGEEDAAQGEDDATEALEAFVPLTQYRRGIYWRTEVAFHYLASIYIKEQVQFQKEVLGLIASLSNTRHRPDPECADLRPSQPPQLADLIERVINAKGSAKLLMDFCPGMSRDLRPRFQPPPPVVRNRRSPPVLEEEHKEDAPFVSEIEAAEQVEGSAESASAAGHATVQQEE